VRQPQAPEGTVTVATVFAPPLVMDAGLQTSDSSNPAPTEGNVEAGSLSSAGDKLPTPTDPLTSDPLASDLFATL
jgi:hypothetical protein